MADNLERSKRIHKIARRSLLDKGDALREREEILDPHVVHLLTSFGSRKQGNCTAHVFSYQEELEAVNSMQNEGLRVLFVHL
jgi:hypothetical protein